MTVTPTHEAETGTTARRAGQGPERPRYAVQRMLAAQQGRLPERLLITRARSEGRAHRRGEEHEEGEE